MAPLLYLASASVTLFIVRRFVAITRYAAAALMLLPLCLTGRAMLTGAVYAPVDLAYHFDPLASVAHQAGVERVTNPLPSDVTAQFIPWNAALRHVIAHGEWPLWNPFELCGNVLAAAAQSAPFHPFTLLGLLLPSPDAPGFMAAMTYLFAALGMFLFLRALDIRELPALFGAAAWALSTYVVAFSETAHGNAIALLPLVMLGADCVARRAGVRATAVLATALVLLTLCGHPETSLHVVALAAVYVLVMRTAPLARVLASGATAGAIALLLTAFFVIPMIDAMPQTREFLHRSAGGEAVTASWESVAHALPLNFIPFAEGTPGVEEVQHTGAAHHWIWSAYAGAMLFAPVLFALLRVRSRQKWFFAIVVVFGLLLGAQAPGVTTILTRLPLFALAVNARMISFAAFGMCMLAAIGLHAALRERALLAKFYAASALLTIAAIVLLTRTTLTPDFLRVNAIREVVPVVLAFVLLRVRRDRRGAAAGLVGLLLLQRVAEIGGFIPTIERRAFFPPITGFERLARGGEPFRIVAQGPLLPPGISAMYGLEDVRGYQAMTFARLAETFPLWSIPQPVWSNRVDDLTAPMLSLMNVRYALALPESDVPDGWRLLGRYPGYQLLENGRMLPRAFVPRVVHAGTREVMQEMLACRDFAAEGWIETSGGPIDVVNGTGSVRTRAISSRLTIHTSLTAPAWVFVSQSAWKGWRATLDGGSALKLRYADRAFLAMRVPAGEHDVELAYRPRAVVNGAIVSAFAALLLLGAFATVRRRRARVRP